VNEWQHALPVYRSDHLTLREIEIQDAESLAHHLAHDDVTRHISPPPTTLAAIEHWIERARAKRRDGVRVCFAIVPQAKPAGGFIQFWRLPDADDAWGIGFVLGREHWGTGIFGEAARAALGIAFSTLEAKRIEAICLVANHRGNRALEKLGAVHIGIALQTADPDGNVGDYKKWEFHKKSY
jgi:ribosomal-protein-alanine N-acetyltransferase